MATKRLTKKEPISTKENAVENHGEIAFPSPRWSVWRQSDVCRIWHAVLLSLNIEPPHHSSAYLKNYLPAKLYQEFQDRRAIVVRQYGRHSLLPHIHHHAQGKKNGEKYVTLQDLLAFGQENGWSEIEHMAAGLKVPSSTQAPVPTGGEVGWGHSLELGLESMPKGERYTLARMGALLEVMESWIESGGKIPASCIKAGKLNFSELERQAVAVIVKRASGNPQSGFGHGVFRKDYSLAKKILEDYFPTPTAIK